jgi:hypothetical protein
MKPIRDRIVEFRRVRAAELRPHPKNWRLHPGKQRRALRGVLDEIGYAGALVARQLPDGGLELIDGHLRAETTPEAEVPVLVVDLDEREAALLLAVHDPLAAMADVDVTALEELVVNVEVGEIDLDAIHESFREINQRIEELAEENDTGPKLTDVYQVIVDCRDEAEQRSVFDRLTADGVPCRVVTL